MRREQMEKTAERAGIVIAVTRPIFGWTDSLTLRASAHKLKTGLKTGEKRLRNMGAPGVEMAGMNRNAKSLRIGIAVAVVLGTIGYLAYSGQASAKSYYVTIPEMQKMGTKAYSSNLRVEGFVKPETIHQDGPNVRFVLTEYESHSPKAQMSPKQITVDYRGSEPPPDTFKDDAQALAIGTLGEDGVFHATQLQAKCASKYAPAAQQGATGAKMAANDGNGVSGTGR